MKLTRMLTKKLTSFWLTSLAAVAFVCLLIAVMSFMQLTYKFQQQKVMELESMLVEHYQAESDWSLDTWLPPMLIAYNAGAFRLSLERELLFEYEGNTHDSNVIVYDHVLDSEHGLSMYLTLPQPFARHSLGWYELLIFLVGMTAIALFVRFGYLWLSRQLEGIEELAQRSQLILQGRHEQALATPGKGKPRLINRALTHLLEALQDAHKERGRLDKFIRANTFLDTETQIGNHLFLKNRLDALSDEHGMITYGVLYLLEMDDLDALEASLGETPALELLHGTIAGINRVLLTQADSIFARRSRNQFAVVVPQISLGEADKLAAKLLKVCLSQPLPEFDNRDNFYHLGGAYFEAGDAQEQLVEEADMALRAAQLQGSSNWFMYDKGIVDDKLFKSSVRWRSFLENALANKQFLAFSQPIMDSDNQLHHEEIFTRVRDGQGGIILATSFIPMANKCGLMPQIERQILERVLFGLLGDPGNRRVRYSVNLSLDSLLSRSFMRWLQTCLLEHRHLTSRLIVEVTEEMVIHHRERLKPQLDMIRKMGVTLCVDHVGQQVVGTYYIKEYHFDLVKLHRSIVRRIHVRQENQLFIRSLIGGLYRADVQICAEGVELFEEWQTLRILGVSAAQGLYFREPEETLG
ncbi:RNase E specificity factor CsrD [Shewanella salipaludis]|uniref:RNase E specificity factor CsrD n=1 Tax=Shewanella salipaludis TaxID=2723052 RepID=A0A972G0E3_9GAMM|nr:RNase E specificity factor CsrD [Shewanella salipaludis]NMH65206.1 RNase E specificity factor CsrD [Shewanella salipaludis]